jgi:hypothetical protein
VTFRLRWPATAPEVVKSACRLEKQNGCSKMTTENTDSSLRGARDAIRKPKDPLRQNALGISRRTAEFHRMIVMQKLRLNSTAALLRGLARPYIAIAAYWHIARSSRLTLVGTPLATFLSWQRY